jgi:hypothetical protein
VKRDLKEIGWTKGRELAKLVRVEGQRFDCAPWVHKARSMPEATLKRTQSRCALHVTPECIAAKGHKVKPTMFVGRGVDGKARISSRLQLSRREAAASTTTVAR